MILWRLRGYTDPGGDGGTEVVGSLQKRNDGYRLLVEHGNEVQVDERCTWVQDAQAKAEALKAQMAPITFLADPHLITTL